MNLRFRIVTVDMNGFNGRDNHPSKSDVGLIVKPIGLAVEVYDEEDAYIAPTQESIIAAVNNMTVDGMARFADKPVAMLCYTCVTEDGRVLDMMDFELEVV